MISKIKVSTNSRLFSTNELRLSTILRECSAKIYAFSENEVLIEWSQHPIILNTDHKPILFLFTQKNKPNQRVYEFQLISMKFPNLHIVWTEGKNFSLSDFLSCSPTTTTQDKHRHRTVEIPDSINFSMTHNQHSQPIQCHYTLSKECINTIIPDTTIESPLFPIQLQIKDNYIKVQLEYDLYLSVSYREFKTKAQTLQQLQQNKTHQFQHNHLLLETYPIVQSTDVTLNTNKTEPLTQSTKNANYTELKNTINFSLPALDDFIPISPEIYNYFYNDQTEITYTPIHEAQEKDPVIRQLLLWKNIKIPSIPSLTIQINKGLLLYYQRFQDLSIIETNYLLYYIQETTSSKNCLPPSFLLTKFYIVQSHDLSGHLGREKTLTTLTENYFFPNIKAWIVILTQNYFNCQTSKSMLNLLMAQQPFLEVSPYFNQRISMDTKNPISLSSDGKLYVYVNVDAVTHYDVLHPSPKNDAANEVTVLFDH